MVFDLLVLRAERPRSLSAYHAHTGYTRDRQGHFDYTGRIQNAGVSVGLYGALVSETQCAGLP